MELNYTGYKWSEESLKRGYKTLGEAFRSRRGEYNQNSRIAEEIAVLEMVQLLRKAAFMEEE